MARIPWTPEEEEKLKEFVLLGKYGFKQMTPFFPGRTQDSLQLKSRSMNLDAQYKYHIHTFDEVFFETPNYVNSFWAGWLCADGCLTNYCGERYSLKWRMSDKDEYFLKLFQKHIRYSGDITYVKAGGYAGETKDGIERRHACLTINRVDIGKLHLRKYGIIPDKVHRIPMPEVNNTELKLAYLVGYINGDGTVCFSTNRGSPMLTIKIYSCSATILQWIKNLIESFRLPKAAKKSKRVLTCSGTENCKAVSFNGLECIYLYEILKLVPVPILDRKWNQPGVEEFIADKKQQHPEWFKESVGDVLKRNNIDFSKFKDAYPRRLE